MSATLGAPRDYRPITKALWAEVIREIGSAADGPVGVQEEPQWGDVSVEMVRAIANYLEDSEPLCDHSVGICACGTRGVLEELRLWLRGRQTCRSCGGDGFVIPDDSKEDSGPLDCQVCEGGSVPLPA